MTTPNATSQRRVADPLESVLSNLLANRQKIVERTPQAFDKAARGATSVVICGAGSLGRVVLEGIQNAGLTPIAFADNHSALWGRRVQDIPVFSPPDAVARFGDAACFVVAIYNSGAVRSQLRGLGCTRIVAYPQLYWRFADAFTSGVDLALPAEILASEQDIRQAYSCLNDARSRAEFASQIQWRCTLDYSALSQHDDGKEIYFPADLIRLREDEVLVDCGAFDGESIRMFLDKVGHKFRYVFAVEPDAANRAAFATCTADLPASDAQKILVLPYAISFRSGTASFSTTGTMGSRLDADHATDLVECRSIDDLALDPVPTFIKMDVEGVEPDALRGAAQTIRSARPILAVCAYHACKHLWELPVLLKTLLPEYQISLRRYAEECWETVYYAIPPERGSC